MVETRKRATAYHIPISTLHSGTYQQSQEEYSPSHILSGDQKISRVHLMGVIVSQDATAEQLSSLILDDSKGEVTVRNFDRCVINEALAIGDFVSVIGNIREYQNDRYVVGEIIKKQPSAWIKLHQHRSQKFNTPIASTATSTTESSVSPEAISLDDIPAIETKPVGAIDDYTTVLSYIQKQDSGEGVEVESLLSHFSLPDESLIEQMLKEGELFENKPGRVKSLE